MGILIKQDIEKDSTYLLAGRCSKIASLTTTPKEAAAKARKLWKEWGSLQTQARSQKRETQLLALNKRMAAFLRGIE